jgi:hypothetical protein
MLITSPAVSIVYQLRPKEKHDNNKNKFKKINNNAK